MDSLWRLIDNRAFVLLSLLLVSVAVLLQSPLAPYANGCVDNDSSIFITVARSMMDGNILYKDVTDHKGPLVFIMDALGLLLIKGKLVGIWFLEVLSLYLTSLFAYRTMRLLYDRIVSLLATCLSLLYLIPVLMGGNLTEEWALPYIAIALYVFVMHLTYKKELTYTQLFVLSFTFVMVFLLKATYICVWCAFGFIILFDLLKEKKYQLVVKYLLSVVAFVSLMMFPVVLYFIHHDAFHDAYYWMVEFNTQYSTIDSVFSTLLYLFQILLGVRHLPVFVILTFFFMLFNGDYKKYSTLWYGSVLSIVLTAYVCAIGGRYEHYYIVFSPLLALVYGYLLHQLKLDSISKRISMMVLITGCGAVFMIKKITSGNYNYAFDNPTVNEVVDRIQKHSSSDATIMGDGAINRAIYVYADRKCVNKYLSNAYSPNISQEVLVKKPQVIVCLNSTLLDDEVMERYSLAESYGQYDIYVANHNE